MVTIEKLLKNNQELNSLQDLTWFWFDLKSIVDLEFWLFEWFWVKVCHWIDFDLVAFETQ
jgi:hypothetical protein